MGTAQTSLGLTEQQLRDSLEHELISAMRAEGGVPTLHAIAHAVARVIEYDHLASPSSSRRQGSS